VKENKKGVHLRGLFGSSAYARYQWRAKPNHRLINQKR